MNIATVKEVSALLKVKEKTLYQWAESKQIPSLKLNGVLRFDLDEILQWVASCKNTPSDRYNPLFKLEARKGGQKN